MLYDDGALQHALGSTHDADDEEQNYELFCVYVSAPHVELWSQSAGSAWQSSCDDRYGGPDWMSDEPENG
jgi:hypothetical protein